jgi:ubiquinol-cytochrome c reductase iron-sulfur subunit
MLAGFGFIACYVLFGGHTLSDVAHSNLALGGTMALTFLALGAGAVIWVRHLMPQVEVTEERHPMANDPEDRAAFAKTFAEGAEASQFVKRPILRRTLIAATVPAVVAPIMLLRDLGPLPGKDLDTTVWRKGMRLLIYGSNRPITAAEFSTPGSMITVVPDGYQDDFNATAKAAVIIIRFRPGQLVFGKDTVPGQPSEGGKVVPNWTVDNIVAYSKICTHVGCPVALYEQTTHHILCPCHQSTFDATRGAKVIFGPATRALPQLPISTDAQGYLVANGPFNEPVGPSFWERS